MPPLGTEPAKNNQLVTVAVASAIFGLMVGAGYWLMNRGASALAPAEVAAADAGPTNVQVGQADAVTPPQDVAAPVAAPAAAPGVVAANTVVPPPAPTPTAAPSAPVAKPGVAVAVDADAGLKSFTATINGPLESAIVAAAGKEVGTALTQVVTRSLVWWVAVPQDLLKGDTVDVVYETRPDQEPLVHAVRFASRKFGKTFEAYRFKPSNTAFAKFYQPDGSELEERLVDSPLDSYEQITSLLRDGRRHKGVDFKTPVGTPVKATFTGTVVRRNWNFRSNGNSLEIEENGGQGRTAIFLHLAEVPKSVQVGTVVKSGNDIATSGNTGHSFAPHLHYQLMKGTKVLDPFKVNKTERLALSAGERPALDKAVLRLRNLMPANSASAASP